MLTYLDSNVLIAAAKGTEVLSERALRLIDDPMRQFVSSPFLRIETLHSSAYKVRLKNIEVGIQEQVDFYLEYLGSADVPFEDAGMAVAKAEEIAAKYGIDALDSMHVAVALLVQAVEFITTDKKLFRAMSIINVRHLSSI